MTRRPQQWHSVPDRPTRGFDARVAWRGCLRRTQEKPKNESHLDVLYPSKLALVRLLRIQFASELHQCCGPLPHTGFFRRFACAVMTKYFLASLWVACLWSRSFLVYDCPRPPIALCPCVGSCWYAHVPQTLAPTPSHPTCFELVLTASGQITCKPLCVHDKCLHGWTLVVCCGPKVFIKMDQYIFTTLR